jgi:disulfide bond formation protein DsbB
VTHDVNVLLAVLGVAGQVVLLGLAIAGLLALFGRRGALDAIRDVVWGYELWLAFFIAATATAGSLFYSEIAGYVPCELCWFQRICMYPLSILTLLMALANDHRAARYLLPLPIVGAGLAIYHMLVERGVVGQTEACSISAPGGCATKWIDYFGYLTIPTLTLTAFGLVLAFLLLAVFDRALTPVEV